MELVCAVNHDSLMDTFYCNVAQSLLGNDW